MVEQPTPPLPEPGQVVEVRGATWAVGDVQQQGLPRSPADEGAARTTHVVTLQSLDEDRLGEELAVVWELELGHTVAPDQGLPERIDGFDKPATLAAFVDAVRWGAVTSADAGAYQSPFRSGANIEAYQLEPLRRALQAPRANLLLADDVGLGKTIEAGLVIQELLLRHRARSVIVVCPAGLALKWQDEMREKFGLDFVIVNSDLMAQVRRSHGLNANPFQLFPRVIVSMSWLPTLRAQRLLRDVYARVRDTATATRFAFDVLVVDEAHHVAPSSPTQTGRARGYAVDSQRTLATRALAEKCEHRLFLSATPHNGHSESFTALLEMIDDRRFSRGAAIDERALREVAVRRLKSELTDGAGALTSSVRHLVNNARTSVTCSTFNVQRSSVLWDALHQAARRTEMTVRVYLDSRAADGQSSSWSPTTQEVAAHLRPASVLRTVQFDGAPVRNHAKFLAIDHRFLLVTSANLSWSAEQDNVELGVLVDDPKLTGSIEREMRRVEPVLYERVIPA